MNSGTILETMKIISRHAGHNAELDIAELARILNITRPALVAMLIELEHRDEIIMDISNEENPDGEPDYSGYVRLMLIPPDEKPDNT
ncbi:hypothetical protein ACTHGU_08915 [Chitinophagaceae bacterium MMS25-I14]